MSRARRGDELLSNDDGAWAVTSIADIRRLDCDHFVPFRTPEVIAEALDASQ